MSAPVLLKETPTALADTSANPPPRLTSAEPVAWNAIRRSARIISATEASLTPARIVNPALSVAFAAWAVATNDSGSVPLDGRFWNAKSPVRVAKSTTFACRPFTATVATPFSTLTGTLTSTPPTRIDSV